MWVVKYLLLYLNSEINIISNDNSLIFGVAAVFLFLFIFSIEYGFWGLIVARRLKKSIVPEEVNFYEKLKTASLTTIILLLLGTIFNLLLLFGALGAGF